jgi:hypothetical protein
MAVPASHWLHAPILSHRCPQPGLNNAGAPAGETPMMDIVMLALALGFFALSIGYVFACERL